MNCACGHGIGIVLSDAIFAVPDLIAFALRENAAYTGVNCFWTGRSSWKDLAAWASTDHNYRYETVPSL